MKLKSFFSDPEVVTYLPILATILLEIANIQQIYRMCSERSSLGQSVWGWVSVNIALWIWLWFYKITCPKEKVAIFATYMGIIVNLIVILVALYFRG